MNKTNKPMGLDGLLKQLCSEYGDILSQTVEHKHWEPDIKYLLNKLNQTEALIKSEALKIFEKAIGEDEPTTPGSYYVNSDAHVSRNQLRKEARKAFKQELEKW